MKHPKQSILSKDGISYLIPFVLITSCFALWGFANDITNPMVKAFSKIFRMSATDGALVQVAFYGGYFAMAFPAAIFIRKYSYKAGVLLGLGMYAFGAFLFFPAKMTGEYYPFLIAYFILTCGLSFLETSCNRIFYSCSLCFQFCVHTTKRQDKKLKGLGLTLNKKGNKTRDYKSCL